MALDTYAGTIDATGISIPAFNDVLTSLQEEFQSIYGSDIVLDNSSQDGQWLGILAKIVNDGNMTDVATFNSFSPVTAQGAGLSSVVKINGIRRLVPSFSTVPVLIIGQAGTEILNGVVTDQSGQQWALPASVIIPSPASQIIITATSVSPGAITAAADTVNQITTPTKGWQSVNNSIAATPGAPVESDAGLRIRQSESTSIPAQTVIDALIGRLENIAGVGRVMVYENNTGTTDANGIAGHTVDAVVEGGDALTIATVIAQTKTPGTGTQGAIAESVIDSRGAVSVVNFDPLIVVPITVQINLKALTGYTNAIQTQIAQQVADFINSLPIGFDSFLSKLEAATEITGANGLTYNVTSVLQSTGGSPTATDIVIAFNAAAHCDPVLNISFFVT